MTLGRSLLLAGIAALALACPKAEVPEAVRAAVIAPWEPIDPGFTGCEGG